MMTQISSLQKKHDVLLMFNANKCLATKAMSDFTTKCGLHNLHSQAPAKTTCHSSSAGRIDYILGTTAVEAAVIQSGTLSYAEALTSDHRGLFVDIDYVVLLQLDTVNQIMPIAGRLLRSGNPEMHDKYIDKVTDYFEKHNMFERLDRIIKSGKRYSKPRLRRLLNKLDADMQAGEQSLQQPIQKFQFSPTLRKFGLLQQYWRTRFKDQFQEPTSERTFQTIEDKI
jgi:hypothetical protein